MAKGSERNDLGVQLVYSNSAAQKNKWTVVVRETDPAKKKEFNSR